MIKGRKRHIMRREKKIHDKKGERDTRSEVIEANIRTRKESNEKEEMRPR